MNVFKFLTSKFIFSVAIISCLMAVPSTEAYFLAAPKKQEAIDFQKPTRILISGRGTDLRLQPQMSALGRAQLYLRNFPNDQVVLISVFEDNTNEKLLTKVGWKIITQNTTQLETHSAMSELLKFQKIRSLDFFGHNSPTLGTQTDGLGFRFDFLKPEVQSLAPQFDRGAYAMIHGCNSGWLIAPSLAKIWNIPVSGSLTGTRFEHLHSDGHFYVYANGKAPSSSWAKQNSDLDGMTCSAGCIRMRPTYSYYISKWGNFNGPTLSHYKFFCALNEKECEKRMALSLYGFVTDHSLKPSSDINEFRNVVKEYLCPVYADRKVTVACHKALDLIEQKKGDPTIHFVFNNKQLSCDFEGCKAQMTCEEHTCKINFEKTQQATTLADEYMHFINGFHWLAAEGI
ncbi:MAG: hypothetical protein ACXVCP_06640 [Bdellovibrio sp.]